MYSPVHVSDRRREGNRYQQKSRFTSNFLFFLTKSKYPIFSGNDTGEILKNICQVLGKPPTPALKQMGKECKMDETGMEMLNFVSNLPDFEPRAQLKTVIFS